MKYSKSAIGLLTAQYRSVLKKCWLINVGLFALGAAAATPANAYTPVDTRTVVAAGETANINNSSYTELDATNLTQGVAVDNSGTLTIENSLFDGNVLSKTGNNLSGGAIYNNGSLTVKNTQFINNGAKNTTTNTTLGGAIYNASGKELIVENSTFTGNYVEGLKPRGAAIHTSGTTTVKNSTFTKNVTTDTSGGLDKMASAIYVSTGNLNLSGSTFGGDNAEDGNIGNSVIVLNGGTATFKDNTFKNNKIDKEGVIQVSSGSASAATFEGTNVIEGNSGSGLFNWSNSSGVTFKDGSKTYFTNNDASGAKDGKTQGGAIYNTKTVTFEDGSTVNFTGNKAVNGGAVYNTGTIDFNGNATFSENTDSTGANDIYNAGTINFGGTADLAGGIDGAAGTVNVSGDVKVANALKNQTVNVNAGELALNAANVSGSTINLASDAVLNTINNAIEDYSSIQLADNSNIKVDANLGLGQMDLFSAQYGHDTVDLNVVEANMIGTSDEEVLMQLVNNGVKVNTSSVIYNWDDDAKKHTKTGIVGSGNNDGKVKVSNGATVSNLEVAARDTSSAVKESVVYEMGESENFGTETVENATFIVEGNNQSVNVSGSFGIDNKSVVTINEATFNGDGSIDTKGKLKITDSNINVDVNVTEGASLESDPTTFSGTVTIDNASTGSFDGDTFASTGVLKNSGTVDFTNMTFESGSKIEKDTTAGTLNFNGGTNKIGAVVTGNNLNLNNGSSIVLTEGSNMDGLALTTDANNGTIDLRNKRIDTLGSTSLGSDLNVLMDIDLTADKSDTLGTITAGGYGLNLNAVELLKLGSDHEEIQIATAGTNVALSSDTLNTLKTYYTNVSYDTGTGILTLDGKASPVTDLIGSWGTGNYIKAYNVADSANTSVGANLTILDAQVKTNADEIASAQTVIGGINDDINVTTAGNYIAAGTEVANNLTALDTQVKANADAVATKLTGAEAADYAVSGKRGAELAANIATYVTANGDKFADVQNTTNIITDLFNDKAAYIQETTGMDQAHSVAYNYDNSAQALLHGSTSMLNADEKLAAAVGSKQAQLINDKSTPENISNVVATTIRASASADDTTLVTEKAISTALETKLTGAEAADYAVSGKRGAELAANIATYVTANGDKFADVQNTTNIITDLFNDKAAYIQETTGMDQAHSVAYNYNQSTQDLLHGATSMLNADEKLAAAVGSKQAQLVNDKDPAENISNVVATTIRASDAASDTTLVTEKAISTALETKVNNAGNFTETTDSALIKDKTVVAAIRDTAAAVDANATKNTTQDNALTNLYSAVNGGTYNTTTGEVTGATALSSNFTATNLTAAANELLTDITVTDDGNYIKANKTAAQNLGLLDTQVKTNAQDIAATAALVGTTSAPKTGTGILAGKTITGTAGTNNLNMVDAIAYVAANAAGLNVDNVYTGKNTFGATEGSQVIITNGGSMSVDKNLTIGKANAISSASNGDLDMGGNTLSNVRGLTLTDGSGHTHDATISATANGVLIDKSLEISGSIKATGIDTSTANTVNLGGTGFTTAVTGNMTVSGDTTMTGKLTVNGDTTLAKTNVTGDLTVTGNTSLANTSVAGTLDVTGAATFGDKTAKFVDITNGAITVHDGTGSSNVTASIANNGDITTKGALDVAGLASLDGGINVNDKFAVDTNGKVTLSDGTNTATIEATQIKDSDGNTINNVMKVDGTGLYTGYVASESGFTVAQKNAVTGLYEETFTVNEDGDIETLGTLSVSDGKFAVDGDGAVKAADGKFTVDKDGAIVAANGGFTVAKDGKTIVGNDFAVTDKFTVAGATGNTVVGGNLAVRDKFTVDADTGNTAVAGTFSAAAAKFTIDDDGAVKAANGNFTVSKEGNTAVAGTMDIEGDTTIGDKFSVTATDGSMSAAGGKFSVNHNGAITAADGAFHVWRTGGISAANGNFTVDKDGNVTAQGNLGVQGTSWLKDTNVDGALSVTGESWLKNTHVDGALATTGDASVGGNFAVTGSSWLSNTHVNGDLEVSGTTKTTALTFNGSSYVAAMDQGDAAITNGVVDDQAKRTMATVATVAKTIGKLDDKNAHGVTDVSDVASAISSLSQNVETATGGTFAGAVWTGAVDADKDVDYTYSPAATATATAGYHDIMSAVSQVASNVGAATTVAFNNVTDDNTVNANIDALNRKVGNMNNIGYGYKNLSNGTTTQPDTVVEALRNIDASMGTIHGLAAKLEKAGTYQGNLAEGTTVEQHLTALDSAIGNRANFNKMHYTQGSKTVVDAIGKLDTKLNSVDHDVRTLRHHFQSGMASAAALSALVPNARAHGNTQLSVGTGMYHGHGAMAVGGFHWFTDNILFNTGIAWDDNEATYRMGVTYSW